MKRVLDQIPPASWAIVMGAGIVSADLHADRQLVLSAIMLWFAAGVWLLLGVRLALRRDGFAHEARSPVVFTGVAGTAVLGTRLALQDCHPAAAVLLAVSGVWWALVIVPVLQHWKTPTVGLSFVLSVATEGLAVLAATLAVSYRAGWLLAAAIAGLLLGLALYVFAAARVTQAGGTLGLFSEQHPALTAGTLVLWCAALAWLLPLLAAEVLRPRPGYDVRRWATVFPLGMYAACSFATGQITGITGITDFAQIWTWVAFTASLLAFAGLLRHGWLVLRSQPAGPGC